MEKLHVILPFFNPVGYRSRVVNYYRCLDNLSKSSNVVIWTIELAIGEQDFQVTEANNLCHYRMHTNEVLWFKENLVNVCRSRLPSDANCIAWFDADIAFVNQDWAERILDKLQTHSFVQCWARCDFLDRADTALMSTTSLLHIVENSDGKFGHSGFAWAATKNALDTVGGLIDWAVIGSGDWYMAYDLIDNTDNTNRNRKMHDWKKKAFSLGQNLVTYADNHIVHYYHGTIENRHYFDRRALLEKHKIDTESDIVYRDDGLIKLTRDVPEFSKDLRAYFLSRREDE